eukprot:scaffold1991_cov111-Isochrysis_galbana.AAC.10
MYASLVLDPLNGARNGARPDEVVLKGSESTCRSRSGGAWRDPCADERSQPEASLELRSTLRCFCIAAASRIHANCASRRFCTGGKPATFQDARRDRRDFLMPRSPHPSLFGSKRAQSRPHAYSVSSSSTRPGTAPPGAVRMGS